MAKKNAIKKPKDRRPKPYINLAVKPFKNKPNLSPLLEGKNN
jgi:hypothetical protein